MKKLVYKPLSNTIQYATISKDGFCTTGTPIEITDNALAAVALYLSEKENNGKTFLVDGVTCKLTLEMLGEEVKPKNIFNPLPLDYEIDN